MSPVYSYQARNKTGERINGILEAEDPEQIARQLKREGYFVTSITKSKKKERGRVLPLIGRVKKRELAFFSQQFSVLSKAGINVIDSLEVLGRQSNHPRFKEVVGSVQENIATGLSLYQSLSKYPDIFPELYCQMVKAGETGGALEMVLNRLASHYERQGEINSRLKTALYYPAAIFVTAVLVIIFLLTEVIPNFITTFASLEAVLPLPTRMIIELSDFIRHYWWLVLLSIIVIFVILKNLRGKSRFAYQFDRLLLKIPVVGEMLKGVYISRFTGSLSLLLANGVDLLSALTIVEGLIGSRVYARRLTEIRAQVREGELFSRPLSRAAEFPYLVVQMVKVGEESGNLEEMLEKASEIYDQELTVSIERAISLIEPVVIVFLAVIVGFIVIAVALPIFEMVEYY